MENKKYDDSELEIIDRNEIGVSSLEVKEEENRLKQEQLERIAKQNKFVEELRQYKASKRICEGIICGVVEDNGDAYAQVLWNDIIVLIRDKAFFEPNYNLGNDYENLDIEQKLTRRKKIIRATQGARCPFMVEVVEINDTNGVIVYGNRRQAMSKLRDYYFSPDVYKEVKKVGSGSIVKGNVNFVGENYMVVEICGVETRIDNYNASEKEFVNNIKDIHSPGDVVNVRIKEVYFNPEVYVKATCRLNQWYTNLKNLKVGDSYLATVESFNPKKNIWTMKLMANGVNVSVHANSVQGNINVNDRVSVMITKVYPEFATGAAIKV